METPTVDVQSELTPTPDQWRQELKEQVAGLWLGDRGLAIERMQRANAVTMATMKFAASGDKATLAADFEKAAQMSGDDMGVNIGNKEIHIHNYPAPPVAETPATTDPAPPTAEPQAATPEPAAMPQSSSNTLGKLVAAGALLASGGIGALGIGMAWDYLNRPAQTTPVVDTDTDTNAGLRFKE